MIAITAHEHGPVGMYSKTHKVDMLLRPPTAQDRTKYALIGKLTAIIGHCEMLELEANASPACKERLQKIKHLALNGAELLACDLDHKEEPLEVFA